MVQDAGAQARQRLQEVGQALPLEYDCRHLLWRRDPHFHDALAQPSPTLGILAVVRDRAARGALRLGRPRAGIPPRLAAVPGSSVFRRSTPAPWTAVSAQEGKRRRLRPQLSGRRARCRTAAGRRARPGKKWEVAAARGRRTGKRGRTQAASRRSQRGLCAQSGTPSRAYGHGHTRLQCREEQRRDEPCCAAHRVKSILAVVTAISHGHGRWGQEELSGSS